MEEKNLNRRWLPLSDGLSVSADRLKVKIYDFGEHPTEYHVFTLGWANDMPNRDLGLRLWESARDYGIKIRESDPPIDKFIKATILLRRKNERTKIEHDRGFHPQKDYDESYWSDEKSFVPTEAQYLKMLIDVAAAKARNEEPLASFYTTLTTSKTVDVIRDIICFRENIKTGANKGKYRATLLRFNESGELCPVEEILLPGAGFIRVVDEKTGYPLETSEDGKVENVNAFGVDTELVGKFLIAHDSLWGYGEPEPGEERLVTHYPCSNNLGLLYMDIGKKRSDVRGLLNEISALRMKDMRA